MRIDFRVIAAVTLLFAGQAISAPPPAGGVYVSMGSSFAAGPKIGAPEPGGAPRCGRSSINYANLVSARFKLKLVDRGCGGATTEDILNRDQAGEGPQIGAVGANARLVTVLIGGNDVNYLGSLNGSSCIFLKTCASSPPVMATAADFTGLVDRIVEIARQVRSRAPAARLIFIEYQAILPAQGSCADTPMSPQAMAAEWRLGQGVDEAIDKGAKAAGAELLAMGDLSRGHDACSADPWIAGYPTDVAPAQASYTPYHPNAKGMRTIAEALVAMLAKPAP